MIAKISAKTVLFVCTGNTCRSPMAEAIARHHCRADHPELLFTSAGIKAQSAAPMTPDAVVALAEHGISAQHESRLLTTAILAQADLVFAMEQRHFDVVQSMLPQLPEAARPQVVLVSDAGDVPDPLGQPLASYRRLAEFLINLLPARLAATGIIPASEGAASR